MKYILDFNINVITPSFYSEEKPDSVYFQALANHYFPSEHIFYNLEYQIGLLQMKLS
jgi:hypothetical protein